MLQRASIFICALFSFASLALAAPANLQIPAAVQAQAQNLEEKFNEVLSAECATRLCAPVGCEVTSFRTLDQKQNSSLPGLGNDEEETDEPQYKLESMRCEFAYEPVLSADAVSVLRDRVGAKVRQAGVSLVVTGRKLPPANPLMKDEQKAKSELPTATPAAPPGSVWSETLARIATIAAITLGLLALIWGLRKLGRKKEVVETAGAVSPVVGTSTDVAEERPSAFSVVNLKESLSEALGSDPKLASLTLEPVVNEGNVEELCRVLQVFGPAPLAYFAQKTEHRDLFNQVHERYRTQEVSDNEAELWSFLKRMERLVALARLGRPDTSVQSELGFLRELSVHEFLVLATDLSRSQILSILPFLPATLRAKYLQACQPEVVEDYARHLAVGARVSESAVRSIAHQLREKFEKSYNDFKTVSAQQEPLLEQLLNTLKPSSRTAVLSKLRTEQPALFSKLVSETLFDDAIVRLPEAQLNELFLALTPVEAAAFLNSLPNSSGVLAKLRPALARSIQTRLGLDLDFAEDNDPRAQQAREKINQLVRQKSARGEIDLRRINESSFAAV